MRDLSVIIPARNEEFLGRTVAQVLEKAEADTDVIVILDGVWPSEPLEDHPRVRVTHSEGIIGQRAATNLGARMSTARYVMKLDAHCALDQGFDRKLITAGDELGHDVTQIPAMYNLHAFNWKCSQCGVETYQSPKLTKCETCKAEGKPFERIIYWDLMAGGVPGRETRTEFWRFDWDLHFQYWQDSRKRATSRGEIADVMSSVGACFFMRRERFHEIGGLDESHGSWGQFGTEIACKSWLSGGRQVVNKRTWFAHLFRTQGKDFGFPYPQDGDQVEGARRRSRELWLENSWPQQRRPLSWLLERFQPVPGWHEADKDDKPEQRVGRLAKVAALGKTFGQPAPATAKTKGLVYYTDNLVDPTIGEAVRRQLAKAALPIAEVPLKPLQFWPMGGEKYVTKVETCLGQDRGYMTMFRQILAGLEALDTDVAFLVEHDVLYHPSHFDFTPPRDDVFYYNQNTWKVDAETGRALHYLCSQTSGCCASRALLVAHYRARVAAVEANAARQLAETGVVRNQGYDRNLGFEPGTNKASRALDPHGSETWMSACPNVDIRHASNLTPSRWSQDKFRDKSTCLGWTEADEIPGWGRTRGRFAEWLANAGSTGTPR